MDMIKGNYTKGIGYMGLKCGGGEKGREREGIR
jgi:hypothetical protein